LDFDKCRLLVNSEKELDPHYKFVVESFMKELESADNKKRTTYKQQMLISNICHSIRTPLNGILHTTNMLMTTDRMLRRSTLKNTHAVPDTTSRLNKDQLSHLNQSAVTLANNIFDIIDMTQLTVGSLNMVKSVFNVRELINQVLSVAKTLTKSKKVSLEYYIEPLVPDYAFSDMKRIKQVLINLLTNSFHNTKKGEVSLYVGASLVYLDEEDNESASSGDANQYNITFTVSDTGIGIEQKVADDLFKPPEILLDKKHYGIGLRVSYLLATKLGGDLMLKSTSAHGSSFVFSIITYEEEQPSFDSNTLKTLKNKRVLLLDDSSDKTKICKVLEDYGMEYTVASSYEEILVLHLEKTFDLVICQTDLQSEDGIVISEQLNEQYDALFLAIADSSIPLPTGVFHERISMPSEPFTIKNKLTAIFNTKYDDVDAVTKLLVVEDEPINRIIIEKLLRSVGYTCIDLASNGKEALDMILANKYDVLLVDIRMPIMNGFELAKEVSKMDKSPIVIGVTAQMILESDPQELFDAFVYKPINIEELDQKIKQLSS